MAESTDPQPVTKAEFYEAVTTLLCLLLGVSIATVLDKDWFRALVAISLSGMMVFYALRWHKARYPSGHKGGDDT